MRSIQEWLIVKGDELFACSSRNGDIDATKVPGAGIYLRDARHISTLRFLIDDREVAATTADDDVGFEATIEGTPARGSSPSGAAPSGDGAIEQQRVRVRRRRVVSRNTLHERITVANLTPESLRVTPRLVIGADFADMLEVRGYAHGPPDRDVSVIVGATGIEFRYDGLDEVGRATIVNVRPAPDSVVREGVDTSLRWGFTMIAPGSTWVIELMIGAARHPPEQVPSTVEDERGTTEIPDIEHAGRAAATRLSRPPLDALLPPPGRAPARMDAAAVRAVLGAAARDVGICCTTIRGRSVPVAGIPWYVALFGRDSLITSWLALRFDPSLARSTLLLLGSLQAGTDEPERDAEPGKILHELRLGELAGAGVVPFAPYYGTADATPLFLILVADYVAETGDIETAGSLRPVIQACLQWIDDHGDPDRDGFVEYQTRSTHGLVNHGWKDSADAVVGADGSVAQGPIALVEVQAYVYRAKRSIARVYEALGEPATAARLVVEAEALRVRFEDAFWMESEDCYALALDGAKRRVESITSNAGHALWAGIADSTRANSLIARLGGPDMFSGWGIRTLSSKSPAYDPTSYHRGSVWPHDNALIAVGMTAYGSAHAAERTGGPMLEAALTSPRRRLPELFSGAPRDAGPYRPYPAACSPQAWSAAAPFGILSAIRGRAGNGR